MSEKLQKLDLDKVTLTRPEFDVYQSGPFYSDEDDPDDTTIKCYVVKFTGGPQMYGEYELVSNYQSRSSMDSSVPMSCYHYSVYYARQGDQTSLLGTSEAMLRYARNYYCDHGSWEGFKILSNFPQTYKWSTFEVNVLDGLTKRAKPKTSDESETLEVVEELKEDLTSVSAWTGFDWDNFPYDHAEFVKEYDARRVYAKSKDQIRKLSEWTDRANEWHTRRQNWMQSTPNTGNPREKQSRIDSGLGAGFTF